MLNHSAQQIASRARFNLNLQSSIFYFRLVRVLLILVLAGSSLPIGTGFETSQAGFTLFPLQKAFAASLPSSNFEIDGNTAINTTGNSDWGATATATDACNSITDNIHSNSAKEDDNPPSTTTGKPPGKADLCSTYIRGEIVGSNVFLYVGFTRAEAEGNVSFDFELNQVSGTRSNGDRLVLFSLDNSGLISLSYYGWNGSAWVGPTNFSASDGIAQMSNDNLFGEAALNLSNVSGFFSSSSSTCRRYISATTRTRSSASSFSASLQDFISPVVVSSVSNCPDITVSKTDGKAAIDAGTANSYTIVITNTGPVTVTGATVNDTLPAALTGPSWSCTAVSPNTCNPSTFLVTIRPGGVVTYTVTGNINSNASGTLTNTVTVTGTPLLLDSNPANNTAIDTTTVRQPDLTISKTATPTIAIAGQTLTYTLVVTNIGTASASNVTLSDTLPSGLTFQSYSSTPANACSGSTLLQCNFGTVVANGSASVQIVALVGAGVLSGTQLINTAQITTTTNEASNSNNQSSVTTPVIRVSDLSIAKNHSTPVIAGTLVTYTITVNNLGPSNVTAATVSDTVPASISAVSWTCAASGGSSCSAGPVSSSSIDDTVNVLVGGQLVYTVVGNLATGATGSLVNVAKVIAPITSQDPIQSNNIATDTVTINTISNLSIAKAGPVAVVPGQNATYVITVSNAGPSDAPNTTISDPAPAGLTLIDVTGAGCASLPCNIGTLLTGQSRTVTVTFAVPASYLTPNPFINTATVTSSNHLTPESASATTNVTPNADLAISKGSALTAAIPGTQVAFTVTVVNNGPSDAQNVMVQDPTPDGIVSPVTTDPPCAGATLPCSIGTIAAGATQQFVVTYTVPTNYSGLDVTNVATVTATTADAIGSNNVATSSLPSTPNADLVIIKYGPASVYAGNELTYTIVVTNNGPSDANGVVVADPSQAGLIWQQNSGACATAFPCNVGTVPAGGSITIYARFLVPSNFPAPGPVTNIVTVTAPADPSPNSASATTDVQGFSTLNIRKDGPAFAVPGLTAVYTIVVTNTGPSDAPNVVVNDPTPAGLTLVSNTGDCVVAYPCVFALLPVGGSRTIVSTFAVPSNYATSADDITNIATANSLYSAEPVTATAITPVNAIADLEINKYDAPDPVVAGTQLTYSLVVTNHGPSDAQSVIVSDTLPAGATLVSASGASWNCVQSNPISCTLAGLVGGASSSIIIVVNVNAGATGSLTNTAAVASETPDSTLDNNSDTAVTSIKVLTQIDVSKTGPATATPGAVINYGVVVSNTGPSNALNVVVTETVPAFTSYTGSGWTCTPDGNAGSTCTQTIAVLAGGGNSQLPFQVTVANPLPVGASQFDNVVIAGNELNTTDPYTVSTALQVVRGLALSKSDGGLIATPGGLVTYTLRYTNTGNIGLSNVVLHEIVPDHSTFVGPNIWQGCVTGSPAGTPCTINLGDVAGSGAQGSTGTVQFVVRVDIPLPAGSTQVQNFADITSREDVGAEASDNTPLNTSINLQLSKVADVAAAVPGGFINYTLHYTNTGNIEAVNVPLQEVVPANTTYVGNGWTCTPNANAGSICTQTIASILGGGGHGSVSFIVKVNSTVSANTTSITNTATLNEQINATVVTPLLVLLGIDISKSDGGIVAAPGSVVTYTIRYTNTGNSGLTGVTLAEVVPSNSTFVGPAAWSCAANAPAGTSCSLTVGALAAQASGSAQFIVKVNTPLGFGVNQINNTVIASSNEEAGGSAGDFTPINTTVTLNLAKTDSGSTAHPGDTVVYTLTYSNSGNVASDATLTETVPANSTFSSAGSTAGWDCANNAPAGTVCHFKIGILAGGGTGGTIKFAVRVNAPVPVGTTQINNAAVIGGLGSPNVGANDSTPLLTFTDVRVSKTDGNINATPGSTVVYTLTYVNNGDIAATDVVVTEVVPANTVFVASASSAGWSCADGSTAGSNCTLALGTLDGGGAGGSLRFAVRLNAVMPAGVQQILNGAFIGSNEGPGTAGSDTTPVIANTDIDITKSDGNITALPGSVVIYTLTVRNSGNIDAATVLLTETVPANTSFVAANSSAGWSCADGAAAGTICTLTIGALAGGGATTTRQFAVRLTNPMPAGVSSVVNTALAGEVGQPEQPPATEVTPVDVSAGLRILKTVNSAQVAVGGRLTYTIQVFNDGPGLALNAVMSDVLVSGLLFQSLSAPAGWTCTTPAVGASGLVRCVNAQFAVGSASFSLVVQTSLTLANGTVLNNSATALGNTPVNTPTVSTPAVPVVVSAPVLVISKSSIPASGERVRNNDLITYTLTVTNTGDAAATNVLISDRIPTGTQYLVGSATPTLAGGPSPLRWSFATLNPGETRTLQFTVVVTEGVDAESGITGIENIGSGISDQTPSLNSNRVVHVFDRTAIHLLRFVATRRSSDTLVQWITDLEVDTFGFELYRSSTNQRKDAVRITPEMIAGRGRSSGASYEFIDTTAIATQTYYYWLQEVEIDGDLIDYGPATIFGAGSAKLYLPYLIK